MEISTDGKRRKITFSSYFKDKKPKPTNMPILLTIPERDYCALVKKYSFSAEKLKKKAFKNKFFFNEMFSYPDNSLTFTNDIKEVQYLEGENWIFDKPEEEDLYIKEG